MSGFFLPDTSVWIAGAGPNGVPEIQSRLEFLIERRLIAIIPPIYFELMSHPFAGQEAWRSNLDGLRFFPMETDDWREAADWTADARRRGSKVRSMDALIAFMAHKHRLTLIHADIDLEKLARKVHLKVESHLVAARRWSSRRH